MSVKRRPFEGVNILDFTWGGAGPAMVNHLGYWGAMVIKVESPTYPDNCRNMPPYADNIPGRERSFYMAVSHPVKKHGITLNLKHPTGIELAKRLVAWADIVADSFTGGTMKRLGLGYDELKKIKPDIITFHTNMQGQTGPMAAQPGFGMVLTSLAGFNGLVGWPGEPPSGLYGAFTDMVAHAYGAACLVAALDYRRRTGKGQDIDVSQHEATMHSIAPVILDYAVNQRELSPNGNRIAHAAPHGIYRCRGEDRWCAIAVFTDEEWQTFCKVIGNPGLASDPRFATLPARKQNEDELDRLVEEWTGQHSAEEVMILMQAAGVGAGVVSNAKDRAEDPQLKHYHAYQTHDHPVMGEFSLYYPPGFILSKALPPKRSSATLLGEANEYVYKEILGVSDEEFVKLKKEGVI